MASATLPAKCPARWDSLRRGAGRAREPTEQSTSGSGWPGAVVCWQCSRLQGSLCRQRPWKRLLQRGQKAGRGGEGAGLAPFPPLPAAQHSLHATARKLLAHSAAHAPQRAQQRGAPAPEARHRRVRQRRGGQLKVGLKLEEGSLELGRVVGFEELGAEEGAH